MPPGSPELISRLTEICGHEHVLTHPHELATYGSDGLLHYHQRPIAAVLPATAEQVQQVVRACYESGTPWVARGSGTGLSGGALPIAEGVLIVLARLRRILSIELDDSLRRRRAGGHQPGGLQGGRAEPLLPPGSLEPDRVLDRRQRGRELRRRALLQVRVHDQLRGRARGRAPRRQHRPAAPRRPGL